MTLATPVRRAIVLRQHACPLFNQMAASWNVQAMDLAFAALVMYVGHYNVDTSLKPLKCILLLSVTRTIPMKIAPAWPLVFAQLLKQKTGRPTQRAAVAVTVFGEEDGRFRITSHLLPCVILTYDHQLVYIHLLSQFYMSVLEWLDRRRLHLFQEPMPRRLQWSVGILTLRFITSSLDLLSLVIFHFIYMP